MGLHLVIVPCFRCYSYTHPWKPATRSVTLRMTTSCGMTGSVIAFVMCRPIAFVIFALGRFTMFFSRLAILHRTSKRFGTTWKGFVPAADVVVMTITLRKGILQVVKYVNKLIVSFCVNYRRTTVFMLTVTSHVSINKNIRYLLVTDLKSLKCLYFGDLTLSNKLSEADRSSMTIIYHSVQFEVRWILRISVKTISI